MSDWRWYDSPKKRPPPKRGVRVKQAGTTWWGKRWIEALERMSTQYANRLVRGRSYARGGRTHDLVVQPGVVRALVTGTRATPYEVCIDIKCLSDAVWDKAISVMAQEARYTAALLAGEMPADIDAAFGKGRATLFPARASDLETSCTCPDWANPCKHVAAAHYVLGEALDRDPFLLFELRGREKSAVLAALRAARSGDTAQERKPAAGAARKTAKRGEQKKTAGDGGADEPVTARVAAAMSLGRLRRADYDRSRAALPTLHLTFDAPPVPAAAIRQLGQPRGWTNPRSPSDRLGPVVQAAAEAARRIALGGAHADSDEASGSASKSAPKATARRVAKVRKKRG